MTTTASPPAVVSFYCRGIPQTKGSLQFWHKFSPDGRCRTGNSESAGPKLKEWRALVATASKRAMGQRPPFSGPVKVGLTFFFPRPHTQPREARLSPYVFVNGRYDIDKLQRAVFDAMTDAAVYLDDGLVARVCAEKRYCTGDQRPGVVVSLEAL